MGRECASCESWLSNSNFSRNQWLKGAGYSRCKSCVSYCQNDYSYAPPPVSYQCNECYRTFNSSNELKMHMQVHRPKNVSCPVCGETRFSSGANAVQHVESGFCSGCRGRDNARQQIYEFAMNSGRMNRYLTETPMLTYGGDGQTSYRVPDKPYHCPECSKSFRNMSQLLQHQDNKHNRHNMIMY